MPGIVPFQANSGANDLAGCVTRHHSWLYTLQKTRARAERSPADSLNSSDSLAHKMGIKTRRTPDRLRGIIDQVNLNGDIFVQYNYRKAQHSAYAAGPIHKYPAAGSTLENHLHGYSEGPRQREIVSWQ